MSLIQSFQAYPALFVTAVTVMSLAVGSFLNVVIHRLPKMLERQWRDDGFQPVTVRQTRVDHW